MESDFSTPVPLTLGPNLIDSKWVYKIKRKVYGSVDTQLDLWQRDSNCNMTLTTRALSILLSKLQLSDLFYPLIYLVDGVYLSWMCRMCFS
jgi:hypothetical protein